MGLVALSAASGCGGRREDPNAIVVAMTNSAVDLDPRVGADEVSQKAQQLTNVAVFQPDIHGVRLSAIADFTFPKDVYRARAQ